MSRDTPARALQHATRFAQDDELFRPAPSTGVAANLDVLRRVLDGPDAKRDFHPVRGFTRFDAPHRLPDELLATAESLLLRVVEASGSRKVALEEGLLRTIAFTASPASLPLFERLLAYMRPRDAFTTTRRTWAVAGVALIAARHRNGEAARRVEALLCESPDKRLRLAAVDAVARLWRTADGDLDADVAELLGVAADDDRDFEPRFAARRWLEAAGYDAFEATGGGVLAFTATADRASRTVEVLAQHTLVDLVSAVVGAFSRDHDHLWALNLSADFDQDDFRVFPEGDPWEVHDGPAAAPIGALGIPLGHRFELIYDLLRRHRVGLELVDVRPSPTPRAKYPRVAKSLGKAPAR